MFFIPFWLVGIFFLLLVWIFLLSVWIYRTATHYNHLVENTGKSTLKEILESLLREIKEAKTKNDVFQKALKEIEEKDRKHIQKIGLIKFNPYGDTGGNQSFALCLLDDRESGIVILSLHGREGTRIYVKTIKQGKSQYNLSKEEKQALLSALKIR